MPTKSHDLNARTLQIAHEKGITSVMDSRVRQALKPKSNKRGGSRHASTGIFFGAEIVLAMIRGIRECLRMNTNQVIEAAKAALTSGKTIHTDYTVTVGGGSKCYKNETSSSASPEVQAANIIDAAMHDIFVVYQKGGEYDDVASDALEAFAREAGFAYLCSSIKG